VKKKGKIYVPLHKKEKGTGNDSYSPFYLIKDKNPFGTFLQRFKA